MKDVMLTGVSLGIGAGTCAVMWCKSVRNERAASTGDPADSADTAMTDAGREGR